MDCMVLALSNSPFSVSNVLNPVSGHPEGWGRSDNNLVGIIWAVG